MQKIIVNNRRFTGFSLVELIVVVLLLGILSVFALGRLFNQNDFAARGYFDDTVTAVRFAQKLAVSTGCAVRVVITASSYQLFQGDSCTSSTFTTAVVNPANRGNLYLNNNMPTGFSLNPAGNITFNAQGFIDSGADTTVTLTDGSTTLGFTVHGTTGLVENI